MIDDYERRFQRSLQKLPIPSWFTIDPNASSSRCSSKQSIVSHTVMTGPSRQPRSYRSCRSSLATSPSPSIHSWHPNYLADRMTLTHRHVSSSSRRQPKYEKGIQRVSKSSHWYQPTKFVLSQNNIDKGDQTLNLTQTRPSNYNHYDTPKVLQTTNQFVNIQTNNNVIKNEKDNVASNLMSEMKQTSMSIKSQIPSLESIPLALKRHDQIHNDDTNTGVREIVEDENALRELDESEINDTDEFFVFAPDIDDENSLSTSNRLYTFAKFSDPSNDNSKQNHSDQNHQQSSGVDQQLEAMNLSLSDDHSNYQEQSRPIDYWCEEKLIDPLSAQLVNHSSFDGVNEETVRIGRILLQSIPTSNDEDNHYSIPKSNPNFQWTEPPTTIEELQGFPVDNEEEFLEDIQHDSGYSSNHERFPMPVSVYEHLLDCYSGSSFIHNDLIPTNLSSITDEAYESEPTTMSSSIATTMTVAHVHPDLEHEFEYPSPPPPVPDRRLKPAHLRTPPMSKQDSIDSSSYTSVQKTTSVPKTTIEHFIASTSSNEVCSTPVKTMSSRHYCGSIPVAREPPLPIKDSLPTVKTPTTKEKRVSKTLNCLHSSAVNDDHDKSFAWIKSSSSSYRNKTKKQTKKEFDEATNGLAIRLPAPLTNGHQTTSKSTLQSHPKSTSTKRPTSTVTKTGSIIEEFKSAVRLPIYETSV